MADGRSRGRGFTLMETVLVVAVGLGLLVGGTLLYAAADRSREKMRVSNALNALWVDARAAFGRQGNFKKLAFSKGVYGETVLQAVSHVPNSVFAGDVIVDGWDFELTMSLPLERKLCLQLVGDEKRRGPFTGLTEAAVFAGCYIFPGDVSRMSIIFSLDPARSYRQGFGALES